MKIAPGVLAALAVIGALLLVDTCARRDERHKQEARMRDKHDDSTVSRLVHEAAVSAQRFGRERDSTGRVIRALRARVPKMGTIVPDSGTAPLDSEKAIALRDTLIAAYEAGRAQDSLQILIWRGAVVARDSLIERLQVSRNAWRREASKPSYLVTDVGGGAIAGWGLAEKNETAVLVGVGVVLVPRALHLLGRVF